MKKILIMMSLAVASVNINAQLLVDSLGRVGVATTYSPKSMLSVGTNGSEDAAIRCSAITKRYGLYLLDFANYSDHVTGAYLNVYNASGNAYGGKYMARGLSGSGNSQYAIGLAGYSNNAYTGAGLMGSPSSGSGDFTNFAGIYGSEVAGNPDFSYRPGKYAGFFNGMVCVTNGVVASILTPVTSTTSGIQKVSAVMYDGNESVSDKLSQVQTLQYLRYDPSGESVNKNTHSVTTTDAYIDIDNMSQEELEALGETALEETADAEPEQHLSPIQYGLDAEQLKAVYPELVYEDANGNVSINYVEMVPLLVQSIKELSAKVAALEGTSTKKAKAKTETTAIEDNVSDVDMVRMDQNKPNPFSESTVISLNIPEQMQKASIFIYDMSGKQVQNISVTERGETNITVYARDLTAGMYIYTLVVDGKVSVTRRMIVSE